MKPSPDEEAFLRHWIYDEAHSQEVRGAAKLMQVENGVAPADLAVIIAAAMPELDDQLRAAEGPPPAPPLVWPWTRESLCERVADARAKLSQARRQRNANPAESKA